MPRDGQVTRRQFLGWSAAALAAMSAGAGAIAYRTDAVGAADTLSADILIAGGGVGGVAAALAALKLGRSVILTEETDWLGGQLTAQAVPPDENPWIETTGCTASYRQFRNDVRSFYRQNYALRKAPYASPYLNPGMGIVSALCHEAPVALAVLTATLKPYQASGKLTVLLRHVPKSVSFGSSSPTSTNDLISAVTFTDLGAGNIDRTVQAAYVLDATELGDLLPLANVDFVTGAESQQDQPTDSKELHALTGAAQPLDQQAVSWCFPMEYIPGEDFTINKPNNYDAKWRDFTPKFKQPWPGKLLSWTDTHPETLQPRTRYLFEGPTSQDLNGDMWHYRRIFWHDQCLSGVYPSDVTLANWPQTDYWLTPLVGPKGTTIDKQTALTEAKELSMSLLYWMQTEAPHPDGNGIGYPGLRTRPDITGTKDGFAKSVYIRESRRIKAAFPIYEKYVGVDERQQRNLPASAEVFPDSVGIGYYRIDLHPSHGDGNSLYNGRTYVNVASYRFQIPLGAYIQQTDKVKNLLPACKNIGTTHVTNGCYRLHPVEWNIGEAAGALAAYCLNASTPTTPGAIYERCKTNPQSLSDFQNNTLIGKLGFVLVWPQVNEQEAPDGHRYGGGG